MATDIIRNIKEENALRRPYRKTFQDIVMEEQKKQDEMKLYQTLMGDGTVKITNKLGNPLYILTKRGIWLDDLRCYVQYATKSEAVASDILYAEIIPYKYKSIANKLHLFYIAKFKKFFITKKEKLFLEIAKRDFDEEFAYQNRNRTY